MRVCHFQPVRKLQASATCASASSLPRRSSALQPATTAPLRSRGLPHPTCVPHHQHQQQQQQKRAMNVAAAALPAALNAALAGIGIGILAAWVDARVKSRKPDMYYTANAFNSAVLDRCPTMQSTYHCTPLLTNGHVETILVAKLRKPPGVVYKREILVTQDGGAVAIDWEHFDDDGKDLPTDAPVLILFPGLTGGSGDSYVQHAVLQARHAGVRAAVFNSRGTADSPVLTPQFYSASFTDDTREVVAHVRKRFPSSTLFAAGWSLGANILVNYLGEQGADTPIEAAVSMCNPFDLTISNRHINEGFNRIYNWNLASSLKRIFLKHEPLWRTYEGPGQPQRIPEVKTIREFDEAITVHSFDWQDVDAYYAGSSSCKRIPQVTIPLLCIQAADDPIAPEEAIPYEAIEQNPNCTLVVTPCGGHLGWAAGPGAPFSEPWTDAAVVEWLTSVHAQLQEEKAGSQQAGVAAAQQQVLQANSSTGNGAGSNGSSRENGRGGDNDDDDEGNGSNGSNGGGYAQQLEPAGVTVGRSASSSSSSSSALTAATPLSPRPSSSSSGSSTFVSPLTSPVSTFSSSGDSSSRSGVAAAAIAATPDTAASSSDASSTVGSRRSIVHRPQQQQQQQPPVAASLLAAASSEPAELMEQLWWGQGLTRSSSSSNSRGLNPRQAVVSQCKEADQQQQLQQRRVAREQQQQELVVLEATARAASEAGSSTTDAAAAVTPAAVEQQPHTEVLFADAAVADAADAVPDLQQQQMPAAVSPFAAVAGGDVVSNASTAADAHASTTTADADITPTAESVPAAAVAAAAAAPAPAQPAAATAVAAASVAAAATAVFAAVAAAAKKVEEEAEVELWQQSVRWAF